MYLKSLVASLLLVSTSTAMAVDLTTEILAKKGVISLEDYEKIKAAQKNQGTVDFSDGLKIANGDKSITAQLGTMLQLDATSYHSNIADKTSQDLANSGSEFRRIRLYMSGSFQNHWDYRTEIDFANGAQLTDGYVSYKGLFTIDPLQLTVGHFKVPFSQESLMGDKGLTFMERSLPNAFVNARAPGVMLAAGQDQWSTAFMVYGEQLATAASNISDEGGGAALRLTWAPLIGDVTLHLGAAYAVRIPSQNNTAVTSGTTTTNTEGFRFRSKPESNISETRLVDTGATGIINVDRNTLAGLELGGSWKALTLNGEYISTQVQRDSGKADLSFDGWYLQGAWLLTGERRSYQGSKGLFDAIKPMRSVDQGGSGAWELALRVSNINLNDGTITVKSGVATPEINGGEERNATLAINWYLNPTLRVSANYVHVLDLTGGTYDGKHLDAAQMRFQLAY
jgi:phosphate-selective porin OprO and OprP